MTIRTWCTAFALAALAVPAAAREYEIRRLDETFPLTGASRIVLDFPVGELEVVAGSGDVASVELSVRCRRRGSRCDDRAERLWTKSKRSGERLTIEFGGWPKLNSGDLSAHAVITVPADRALEVDMGVGELEIRGLTSDLDIELGVGEVSLELAAADLSSVSLDAGIGETDVRSSAGHTSSDRSWLIGSHTHWRGDGRSRVDVELGVGEITARLR